MSGCQQAELVGADGELRDHIVDALREDGWNVAARGQAEQHVDLGIFVPADAPPTPLDSTPPAVWWAVVDEQLTSAFRCARELTPRLSASAGALVFVSSLFGEIGAPERTASSAAAAGIVGLVKALTLDVPAVRFSAVAPLWPPPKRLWEDADMEWLATTSRSLTDIARATAAAVVFLANDKEGHLRGQVIRIPSGVTT